MTNNKRNRKAIKTILEGKQLTTIDVHDALNLKFRQGPTMNQVGNLLSRIPEVEKIGLIDISTRRFNRAADRTPTNYYNNNTRRVRVALWRMKTD
jgi:hypothetical protein